MSNIALMGGSFNPVHQGHLIVASWTLQHYASIDEVWLMPTPQNPLKRDIDGATEHQRLDMIILALHDTSLPLRPCQIEMDMPLPNYTINTLTKLGELYPQHHFSLLIGADNWSIFHLWRSSKEILDRYGVYIYPRKGYKVDIQALPENANWVFAPSIDISSSLIRDMLSQGMDISYMVPPAVKNYINDSRLYQE